MVAFNRQVGCSLQLVSCALVSVTLILSCNHRYQSGDHSLPHTDWVGQRTVSYVWHLSKGWRPEWGGALYWAHNDHAVATFPARALARRRYNYK